TVCRIFSCQRSAWGAAPPKPPARSLAGTLRSRSARSPESLARCRTVFAALKPRSRLRPRLVGAPQEQRAAGRTGNNQAMDVGERETEIQPHCTSPKIFQRTRIELFCGRAVRASLNLCLLPARHCLAKRTLTFVRRLA